MYHPRDTVEARNLYNTRCDNLWYHIHYFQKTDHRAVAGHEGLVSLKEKLALDNEAKGLLNRLLQHNWGHLGYIAGTHEVRVVRARGETRILVGMGAAHCRETSLTLHPVYGIPYIPGSSVKGVMRSWFLRAFFDGDEGMVERSLKNEVDSGENAGEYKRSWSRVFLDLFGSQDKRGFLTCLDVFLGPECEVVPDVLTVHFPRYYQKKGLPSDTEDPKPVNFYTVKLNRPVEFVLALEKPGIRSYESGINSGELAKIAVKVLEKALSENGIGSKTSSGYGYFVLESVAGLQTPETVSRPAPPGAAAPRPVTPSRDTSAQQGETAEAGDVDDKTLAGRIARLNPRLQKDCDDSKSAIFEEVLKANDREAAKALIEFWKKAKDYPGTSKKQKQRVKKLEDMIQGQE